MKMQDYRLLTREQKLMMVQRDFAQISSDLKIYNRLAKRSGLLAEAFAEVNGWWKRPVNRSKEDYALAQAYADLQEAQRGNDSSIKGAREVLAAVLEPVQYEIEMAMQSKAGLDGVLPERGNAVAVRQFWETHVQWNNPSIPARNEELDAVAFFWDNGKAEDVLVNAVGQNKPVAAIQEELYKKSHLLRRAFGSLGVAEQDFDNHAVGLRAFCGNHGRVLSQMYGKDELGKLQALNHEKIRVAEQDVWEKALGSLRPEGRMRTFKNEADYKRGANVEEDAQALPPIVSLRQEMTNYMKSSVVGQMFNKIWTNPKKKRATIVATGVSVLAVAGYVVVKALDDSKPSGNGNAPKESFQDRLNIFKKNGSSSTSADSEDSEPEYEDEDALRAESGQAVIVEDSSEDNPLLKDNVSQDSLKNDSADSEPAGLFEPDIDPSKRSVIDILVKEEDRSKIQNPEVLNMLKKKLEENQEDVNAPRMALEQPSKDQRHGGNKQKYTPN